MDKEEIKEFFNWLESASEKEKENRHKELVVAVDLAMEQETKGDAYFMVKHIEIDMLAEIQANRASLGDKLRQTRNLQSRIIHRQSIRKVKEYVVVLEKKMYLMIQR